MLCSFTEQPYPKDLALMPTFPLAAHMSTSLQPGHKLPLNCALCRFTEQLYPTDLALMPTLQVSSNLKPVSKHGRQATSVLCRFTEQPYPKDLALMPTFPVKQGEGSHHHKARHRQPDPHDARKPKKT